MPRSSRAGTIRLRLGQRSAAGDASSRSGRSLASGVIHHGAARELAGEPRDLGGHARERYVYAPCDGRFRTEASLGDRVRKGQEIAAIGAMRLAAPLDGVLRGLVRDGVPVAVRTKLIEVDPRGDPAAVVGLGERPRRIAHGVLLAINAWRMGVQSILGPA